MDNQANQSPTPTKPDDPKLVAARVLAATCSRSRAAKKAGVDLETIKRWQKDPEFCELLLDVKTTKMMTVVTAMIDAGETAAKVLKQELEISRVRKVRVGRPPKDEKHAAVKTKEPDELDARKIRAAKLVLELLPKYMEIGEFIPRLRRTEEHIADNTPTVTQLPPADETPEAEQV